MVPRLLPASDHAARVVVRTDAVVDRWPRRERSGSRRWGWCAAHVGLLWRRGTLFLGWLPPTMACATNWARGSSLPAVERGAFHLLDGGKFDQIPHLTVKVSLGRILRLWQRLQQDCDCCDILTCTELLRELHAGVVDDVVVDRTCASTRGTCGVHPL